MELENIKNRIIESIKRELNEIDDVKELISFNNSIQGIRKSQTEVIHKLKSKINLIHNKIGQLNNSLIKARKDLDFSKEKNIFATINGINVYLDMSIRSIDESIG